MFFLLSEVALAFGCNLVWRTYHVHTCDLKGNAAVNAAHDLAGFMILGITLAGLLVLARHFRPRHCTEVSGRSSDLRRAATARYCPKDYALTRWGRVPQPPILSQHSHGRGGSRPYRAERGGIRSLKSTGMCRPAAGSPTRPF